ncbi:MAG: hypothetical protein ACKVOB_02410 [Sphingomonas sp.]
MRYMAMLVIGTLTVAGAPVLAGPTAWTPVRDRKPALEALLAKGVKSGKLQSFEPRRARDLYDDISRRERRYEANPPGLTLTEKRNLDFRFNGLMDELRKKVGN